MFVLYKRFELYFITSLEAVESPASENEEVAEDDDLYWYRKEVGAEPDKGKPYPSPLRHNLFEHYVIVIVIVFKIIVSLFIIFITIIEV